MDSKIKLRVVQTQMSRMTPCDFVSANPEIHRTKAQERVTYRLSVLPCNDQYVPNQSPLITLNRFRLLPLTI